MLCDKCENIRFELVEYTETFRRYEYKHYETFEMMEASAELGCRFCTLTSHVLAREWVDYRINKSTGAVIMHRNDPIEGAIDVKCGEHEVRFLLEQTTGTAWMTSKVLMKQTNVEKGLLNLWSIFWILRTDPLDRHAASIVSRHG